ncbi:MAG: pilus assembly protein [Pseudobutyrivibrio sp.]|nr:pilus assembly protein [Pseudobutyrivibrio sp.]
MSRKIKFSSPKSLIARDKEFNLFNLFHINKNSIIAKTHDKPVQVETPIYTPFKKASYTIEAAIVMPIFITIMVFGMFIFRLLQVQAGVQQSINYASRTMAVTLGSIANGGESDKDVEIKPDEPTVSGEISEAALMASTIALCSVEISKNEAPISFVDGGVVGFNFFNTSVEGNYIDIKVDYVMTFPVGLIGDFSFEVNQRARCRKWVGYDKAENTTDSRYVYITEHGEAYHNDFYCTYLNPSVHRIPKRDLKSARNKGGAIYYKCEKCGGKKAGTFIFITDYGTAYHTDINCTNIKHNISKVPYEEVKDTKRPCSKCAAGENH